MIAATNVDLRAAVDRGEFREDLFFRLNVFPIKIPPLRERREDIPLLIHHFLRRYAEVHGRRFSGFTTRALNAMLDYRWPGNIRELENVVERGMVLGTEGQPIDIGHLFFSGERLEATSFKLGGSGRLSAESDHPAPSPAVTDLDADRVARRVDELLRSRGEAQGDIVSLGEIEDTLIRRAVERANGNVSAAARLLGMTRSQLVYRMRAHDIHARDETE